MKRKYYTFNLVKSRDCKQTFLYMNRDKHCEQKTIDIKYTKELFAVCFARSLIH